MGGRGRDMVLPKTSHTHAPQPCGDPELGSLSLVQHLSESPWDPHQRDEPPKTPVLEKQGADIQGTQNAIRNGESPFKGLTGSLIHPSERSSAKAI